MNFTGSIIIKFIVILCVALLTNQPIARAQTTVTGTITDDRSNESLPGVTIRLGGQIVGVTGADGHFSFTTTGSGPQTLTATYVGYDDWQRTILLESPQVTLAIKLVATQKILNQVVVSAGRYEQDVKRLTVSTEVIRPYLIENKATANMEKLVEQIPAVNVVDGQINIRGGSGWTYGTGSRVLVMIDDMPLLTGDGGQVPWRFIPTENISQVEVIKGASSVLYGSSALNGMVNIRTASPGVKPVTSLSMLYGVYDEVPSSTYNKGDTKLQAGCNFFHSQKIKNLDLTLASAFFHDEGYRYGESEERQRLSFHTRYHHTKIAGLTSGINASIMTQHSMSFQLWESFDERYITLDRTVSVTRATDVSIDPHADFFAFGLKHRVRTRMLYIDYNNSGNNGPDQSNGSTMLYGDYQVQKSFTFLVLTAGINASHTESNSPLYGGFNSAGNAAPFFQADAKWKRVSATGGVRYENFRMNAEWDHRLITRAGLNIELARYTFLRTSYGEGYRYPTIAERYINTSTGLIHIFPNPQLRPETGWNAEVGIKQGIKLGNWQGFADVALFRTEYNDMVEFNFGQWTAFNLTDPFASLGFKSYNVGRTRIDGIDCSLAGEGKAGPVDVRLLAGFTQMNPVSLDPDKVFASDSSYTPKTYKNTSTDTSNNVLKYRYNQLAKLDAEFTYKRVLLGVSMKYNSYMKNIDNVFVQAPLSFFVPGMVDARNRNLNGDFIWDMRLGVSVNNYMKVNAVVSNLFRHEMMTRPADMRPPRLFTLQLSFRI